MVERTAALLLIALAIAGCTQVPKKPDPLVCTPAVSCPSLSCPAPEIVTREVKVQVEVPVSVPATQHTSGGKELAVIGSREYVTLLDQNVRLEARVDTGAETSSLHAINVTPFEREGRRWVKFQVPGDNNSEPVSISSKVRRTVIIKQIGAEDQRRFVVDLWVKIGDIREQLSFTLANREGFDYQILLGRNFLTDTAIVDVSRKHVLD